MSVKKNTPKNEEDLTLQEALVYDRFHHYLKHTNKCKDLYWSKEAATSLLGSIVLTLILWRIVCLNSEEGILLAKSLIPVIVGGLFTLLGLSLAGLAIISSTFTEEFFDKVIEAKSFRDILDILFNFYFTGFTLVSCILYLIFSYLFLFMELNFNLLFFNLLVFSNSYLFIFSLISSVMLLGTCIRMTFIKYAAEKSK